MSSRKESDRFYSHVRGVTKTLKKLFNEMKIPEEKRDELLVLTDDEVMQVFNNIISKVDLLLIY